jgi:hypothetical protein
VIPSTAPLPLLLIPSTMTDVSYTKNEDAGTNRIAGQLSNANLIKEGDFFSFEYYETMVLLVAASEMKSLSVLFCSLKTPRSKSAV